MFRRTRMAFIGLTNLPHVGTHPGIPLVSTLIGGTFLYTLLHHPLSVCLQMLPFYGMVYFIFLLMGGYGRTKLAHSLMRANQAAEILQAYVDITLKEKAKFKFDKGWDRVRAETNNEFLAPLPKNIEILLSDALTINGMTEIPQSIQKKWFTPNELSAHDRLKSINLLNKKVDTYPYQF